MSVKSGSVLLMLLTGMAVWSPQTISADIETTLEGLEYRLIGPWRGGRVTTVTGLKGKPNLYYMGATGGGVWKTTNAGVTWENISDDGIPVGTGKLCLSVDYNYKKNVSATYEFKFKY